MKTERQYDVVIIGGSYAGLSAAMSLGRARKNVLIIDSGKPCNASAAYSHNFLTQDGVEPSRITSLGKEQVLAYPTISFIDDLVIEAQGLDNDFKIVTFSGLVVLAKKLLFSAGIKDLMPEIPGFGACWGKSIIHCPYCHGYEYRDQPTGLLANGDMAFEFGRLICNWTNQLTIFTNGSSTLKEEQLLILNDRKIIVHTEQIKGITHEAGDIKEVLLANGNNIALDALYAKLPFEQHCRAVVEIGCEINEQGFVEVDDFLKTSIPGIYAAGDCTTLFRSLAGAVASGSKAGAMLNHEIIAQQ